MDIFQDEEGVETSQIEATEPQETEGPVRNEKGQFAPKGENEGSSPEPVTEEPQFEHAAVIGERKRRQDAEARIAALEQQIQQAQQEPPAPPPSIWEDEQGALQHHGDTIAARATFNARLDMSEMLASQAHQDFDEMKAKFVEMMGLNPALQQQALAAKHPWEKAYQIARNAAKMEALGAVDVADMEAKLREQIVAELTASRPAQTALPHSLADAPAGRGSVQPGQQPFTLEDIIGR